MGNVGTSVSSFFSRQDHLGFLKIDELGPHEAEATCLEGVINQKAIVPMGRPSPYSIIILNMRFIPKASLRASSQITASSYILERHL